MQGYDTEFLLLQPFPRNLGVCSGACLWPQHTEAELLSVWSGIHSETMFLNQPKPEQPLNLSSLKLSAHSAVMLPLSQQESVLFPLGVLETLYRSIMACPRLQASCEVPFAVLLQQTRMEQMLRRGLNVFVVNSLHELWIVKLLCSLPYGPRTLFGQRIRCLNFLFRHN